MMKTPQISETWIQNNNGAKIVIVDVLDCSVRARYDKHKVVICEWSKKWFFDHFHYGGGE